jgi:uncharacterized protein (TIGR00255 family)
MTGFGRAEAHDEELELVVSIQTLNKRHLDIQLQLPPSLIALESSVRNHIKKHLHRGQVRVTVSACFKQVDHYAITPNVALVSAYQKAWKAMQAQLGEQKSFPLERLVDHEEFFQCHEALSDELVESVEGKLLAVCEKALNQLIGMRSREGAAIQKDLEAHFADFAKLLKGVPDLIKHSQEVWLDRLKKALVLHQEAITEADESRLAREAVMISDKIDITEELNRCHYHLDKVQHILSLPDEAKGKRLEFILQELFREVNTVGSKSANAEISGCVVELKCLLEKVREQVQNVE